MKLPGPQFLGLTYLTSELLLMVTRRATASGTNRDRGTLRILWVVIGASIIAGLSVTLRYQGAAVPSTGTLTGFGDGLFAVGLALRWWAIVVLGRFFTVDVQISEGHRVIENGPFALMRHPSYTGALLAFLGFALTLANWAAWLVILLPITAAFLHRMKVEEAALLEALGESYRSYSQRTKRLIPGVY